MHPDMKRIGRRVFELRKSLGLNQSAFARLIGADQSTVSRWESDRGVPDPEFLLKLANLANTSVNDFLGEVELYPIAVEDIRVIGKVEAGTWGEALEWQPDQQFAISVEPHPAFQSMRKYGLKVVGPSMNLEYPDGTLIICVDLAESRHRLQSGDHVVVERRKPSGLIEVTVKEYSLQPDGSEWAIPRSTDPRYSAPYRLAPPTNGENAEEIRVLSLVIGSYRHRTTK